MAILYASLISRMNNKKYKVYIRGEYEPVLPDYFKDGLGPPVVEDMGEEALSFMTIPFIIDMCFNEVPFRFVNGDDVDEVVATIEEYMNETKEFEESSEDLQMFFIRCRSALKSMGHIKKRRDVVLDNTIRKNTPKDALTTILRYL